MATRAKKPAPYRGMLGASRIRDQQAVDGLIGLLVQLADFPLGEGKQIHVHGTTKPTWRIVEISFTSNHGRAGSSVQRCVPENLGLLAACEDYLREFHTKPERPAGWTTDLDPKADAEAAVRVLWKAGEEKVEAPPQSTGPKTAQDLALALTRGTGLLPVVLAADPEGNEFHLLGEVEVGVPPPAELRRPRSEPLPDSVVILWPR